MSNSNSQFLTIEQREIDINKHEDEIYYSPRYYDDEFEYRHVVLPKEIAVYVPKARTKNRANSLSLEATMTEAKPEYPSDDRRLMSDLEWRSLGVKQSAGWNHYMIHEPEPHILLFKREKDYQLKYPSAVGGGGMAC